MSHPDTTPLAEARDNVLSQLTPLGLSETVPVRQANKRFAAEDLVSDYDLPPSDNAAVDGFGIHAAFLAHHPDHAFRIVASARAGHPFDGVIKEGEAVRIFTGAMMPTGPDCIFMHEDCEESDGFVRCALPARQGMNVRPRGENLSSGEVLLTAGQKLTPAIIGQLSAAGVEDIKVSRQLRVAILSTGDEIIAPGMPLQKGHVFDANAPMLSALVGADGHAIHDGGIVPDERAALVTAYKTALETADVILSSGGASDGDEDHTQGALRDSGADCLVWRLAMKPGRPMAVGLRGNQLICCLPGNPVAAFVCYKLLVAPLLDRLAGGKPQPVFTVRVAAGFSQKKRAGRAEYLRARIETDATGASVIQLHGRKGAGVISSLTGAEGLVELPLEAEKIIAGQMLSFMPFQEIGI